VRRKIASRRRETSVPGDQLTPSTPAITSQIGEASSETSVWEVGRLRDSGLVWSPRLRGPRRLSGGLPTTHPANRSQVWSRQNLNCPQPLEVRQTKCSLSSSHLLSRTKI
jgi:hypothetical protein